MSQGKRKAPGRYATGDPDRQRGFFAKVAEKVGKEKAERIQRIGGHESLQSSDLYEKRFLQILEECIRMGWEPLGAQVISPETLACWMEERSMTSDAEEVKRASNAHRLKPLRGRSMAQYLSCCKAVLCARGCPIHAEEDAILNRLSNGIMELEAAAVLAEELEPPTERDPLTQDLVDKIVKTCGGMPSFSLTVVGIRIMYGITCRVQDIDSLCNDFVEEVDGVLCIAVEPKARATEKLDRGMAWREVPEGLTNLVKGLKEEFNYASGMEPWLEGHFTTAKVKEVYAICAQKYDDWPKNLVRYSAKYGGVSEAKLEFKAEQAKLDKDFAAARKALREQQEAKTKKMGNWTSAKSSIPYGDSAALKKAKKKASAARAQRMIAKRGRFGIVQGTLDNDVKDLPTKVSKKTKAPEMRKAIKRVKKPMTRATSAKTAQSGKVALKDSKKRR